MGYPSTDSELKLLTDLMTGAVLAADLMMTVCDLDANAARIDLVDLTAKGIEFA